MSVSQRGLKRKVLSLLAAADPATVKAELDQYPPDKLLNPLFTGICHHQNTIKWNAVAGIGPTVARLADQDMEAARIVMRRFMWSLNDESGGIGWGIPEAMAECLVYHAELAQEYTHILVSFMREDGFYLELANLQRGLMWALARLGAVRPELLHKWKAVHYLTPYLESSDCIVQVLAARALAVLGSDAGRNTLEQLKDHATQISLLIDETITVLTVGEVALQTLAQHQ